MAVLDVNLGGGATSEPVAVELRLREIPFIGVSGYTADQHSAVFSGAPLLAKPVRIEQPSLSSTKWLTGSKAQALPSDRRR
jgi:hypothetical protein